MAVAEPQKRRVATTGAQAAGALLHAVRAALRDWRSVLIYIAVALALQHWVPARLELAPATDIQNDAPTWVLSERMRVNSDTSSVRWQGVGAGPHTASRLLQALPNAEFLGIRACAAEDSSGERKGIYLASIRNGALDFNRQYFLRGVISAVGEECVEDAVPRRRGDGDAVLQIQLADSSQAIALSSLSVTPLFENPLWRWLRYIMLACGLVLLAQRFAPYLQARPMLLAISGLVIVAGILFGCCVSVSQKADIYVLLTGGRSLAAPEGVDMLLRQLFPVPGTSVFTILHALLFAAATLCLGWVKPWAALDLLLLALSSEALQIFVPGRGPGLADALVDASGVVAAVLLLFLARRAQRVGLLFQ
jgi:hypothetical protein